MTFFSSIHVVTKSDIESIFHEILKINIHDLFNA